jgi:hypothetical protein
MVLFIASDIFIIPPPAVLINEVPSNVKADSPFIVPPPVAVKI